MKTKLRTAVSRSLAALLLVMLISGSMMAQSGKINARSIADLKRGIQSENHGVKKSSIYFAGLYEIEESVEALAAQLEKEEDAQVRILIALSLYRIGNEKAISAVEKLAVADKDMKVRKMGTAILNQFGKDSSEKTNIISIK
jgi:HEAT repeat protein